MIQYEEFQISAYHNYLVNNILIRGFVVGNPESKKSGYLLANIVPLHENRPRISARIVDGNGKLLFELIHNQLNSELYGVVLQTFEDGFRIVSSTGESLLEVITETFLNGKLTRIRCRIYDEEGRLLMDPRGDNVWVSADRDING